MKILVALMLLGAAGPALAEYATYQGQVVVQGSPGDACAALSGDSTFNISVYGRDDAPGERIDAYIFGDKLVPVHVTGNNVARMSMMYPGESSPSHILQLRPNGPGAFSGQLQIRTLIAALTGCGFANANITFSNVGMHTQADYQKAAALFQQDARAVIAYSQGLQGKVKEALPEMQQGLMANQAAYGENHPQLLPYYVLLARTHNAAGSYPDEIPLYRKAVALCEHAYGADSPCTGLMLASLSQALLDAGSYAEAESSVRHALAICDRVFGRSSPLSGNTLNALGAVLIATGRYGDAETTLNQALAFNKQAFGSDNTNVGVSYIDLGVLYRFTGQYDKAESAMRQALAIDMKAAGPDNPLTLINAIYLGQILRLSGHYREAETLCRNALATAQRVLGPERPDHPALNKGLLCLAGVLADSGRFAEAEPIYRQAVASDVKYLGPDNPDLGNTLLQLAHLLRATGREPEALTLLKNAYRIAHVSGNQMISWRVPGELMQVYGAGSAAKPAVAIFYGKEAVNNLQQLRSKLGGSANEAQQAFVGAAEVNSVYKTLANLLIADGRLSEAQQVLAMLKEQEFYDFTRGGGGGAGKDARKTVASLSAPEKQLDDLNSKDVSLGRELGALQEKLKKDHQLNGADRERLNTLRKQMDAAQAVFDAQVTAVAKSANDPEAQKLRKQQITDLSRSFQGTLKEMGHDAVLAQYFILDDKVQILLTTPNVEIAREAPIKRDDLNAQIRAFRATLSNPSADPVAQSKVLYKLLIGPIAADLQQANAKMLMLSLDDTLRYLPFAALHDDTGYLVERMSLAIVNEAARDKLNKAPSAKWTVWGLGVTKAHDGADALPFVGAELNGIAGPQGILTGKVMLDSAFNEESLRDGLDQAYPIIHIASHFKFEAGSMEDSVLLLGDGSRLTLAEIKNKLNFSNVDLLTLSACETAVGDEGGMAHHGIEVEGLGAIAQQAGAKSVIASLWSVSDTSTALLMRTMYESHKSEHLTKGEALRFAQLALLRGTVQADPSTKGKRGLSRVESASGASAFQTDAKAPFAHPFFWAPFILMGNWL